MKPRVIPVGLGELKLSRSSGDVLACYGLGSCVGVALFDPVAKAGAMVHIMLPDSALARGGATPAKFADTAIPYAIAEIERHGAARARLQIKLAGGAQMLAFGQSNSRLDIGSRNIDATMAALAAMKLTPAAAELGGNFGRTMQLMIADGRVVISTIGRGEMTI
ncbi:MAG: chemotaxis protein CheD [Chloroflexota bacterium]